MYNKVNTSLRKMSGSLWWIGLAFLILMQASATQATSLAPAPVLADTSKAAKIVFVSDRDGNSEIYLSNIDGTNQVNLTNNPADDWDPAWSPDGKRIAFASNRDGNSEIYVIDANGANSINLTKNPGNDVWPDWAPDGEHIVFVSDRDGNDEIYMMDADGSNQINLTKNPAPDRYPTWSPDGTRIAFASKRGGYPYDVFLLIHIMNADGTQVTRVQDISIDLDSKYLSWSPNGKYIAVTQQCALCPIEIKLFDVESKYSRSLRENAFGGSFSPDSSHLVFACWQDGSWEICLLDVATKKIVGHLTNNDAVDLHPDWAPEVTPVAPLALSSVFVSSSEIRFSWHDDSDNEAGFKIERKEDDGGWKQIATVATNVNSYSDSHISPQRTYSYRVRAYNNVGSSSYSNTITVATPISLIAEDARSALNAAASSVAQERSKGFEVPDAEDLLARAEQAFESEDYETALELASDAMTLAVDTDQDGVPNDEDFAPTIKNIYIYVGASFLALFLMISTSIGVWSYRRKKRAEQVRIDAEKAEIVDMIEKALKGK